MQVLQFSRWHNYFGGLVILLLVSLILFPLRWEEPLLTMLQVLYLPRNLASVKDLGLQLQNITESSFPLVWLVYFAIYLLLQTCAIPGSIFLSILGGYLFPTWIALFTVCLASASGATLCFILSKKFCSSLVQRRFPERLQSFSAQLEKQHENSLFFYLLFLRITPFLPNWFINIGAPHLDVPINAFFWGTFFGVCPPSFLHVQAGAALDQLNHDNFTFLTFPNVLFLSVVSVLAILPVLLSKKILTDKTVVHH